MTSLSKNSSLRFPLTDILGSKSNVLALRELIKIEDSVSHSKIINRTGLSKQGTYDVISKLNKLGITEYAGSGGSKQIRLRKEYPLTKDIIRLFKAEENYFNQLIQYLKNEVENLKVKPKSAWIYGKVASGVEDYGDPLQVALFSDLKTVDKIVREFKELLFSSNIESKFDVTIEVKGITIADEDELKKRDKILLWGTDAIYYLNDSESEAKELRSHQILDERSLTDIKAWINFLNTHPEIIERTKTYLENKINSETSGVKNELKEWKRILENMSFQRLKKFMQSESERSTRMRQSLPFWPVLSEIEKDEFKSTIKDY